MRFKMFLFVTVMLTAGCAAVDVNTYQGEQPELKLEEYFNGTLEAWGMFQERGGKVAARFKVAIDARWEGDRGVLDERFVYSDGSTQQRVWQLIKTGEDTYTGRADDVVGIAQGRVSGNSLHWTYTLKLPVGDNFYEVQFDDWMYLQHDGVMINRSVMKKFGIRLGEVTLFFKKRS